MFCGKCGANVPDGYEFCMKCGAKLDITQAEVSTPTENAVPVPKAINKKVLIPVIGVIAVIVVAIALMFGLKEASEKNGYCANIPWGTDIETVQKKVDKTFKCESKVGEDKDSVICSIEDYDGMKGVSALLIFYCNDNGSFNNVSASLFVDDDSKYTGTKIKKELVAKYDKLFGESENSNGQSYVWETKNSTINLFAYSEDFIMLTFEK